MNYEYVSIGAAALSVILLSTTVMFYIKLKNLDRLRKEFSIDGADVKVDDLIMRNSQDIKQLREQLDELGQYTTGLAAANKKNFQKIGFVRFNPFGDAGGSISFVLALLDADQNGFVVSSLHGREGNRVYAKEVRKGASKSQLTEEELEAIKIAA